LDEVLLADNEEERNDWLAKLNYAAAFRTSGIRMRGVVGANYDGQGRRGMRRLDNSDAVQLIQTPTGPVSIARGHIDHKMAEDIQTARRDGMQQKICEADQKVEENQKLLEEQLRNARHLQILAPIQPRTREQLLLAAARVSAQLKWTRMEIWREKCHRDILVQDLAEDETSSLTSTCRPDSQSIPTPHPSVTRSESKPKNQNMAETSTDNPLSKNQSIASSLKDIDSPIKVGTPQTPPQTTTKNPPHAKSDASMRHGSISSIATDAAPPAPITSAKASHDEDVAGSSGAQESPQDDVDASERDFLKQAGLWEARSRRGSSERATMSTVTETTEYSALPERDRLERSKIRRSLQRTLRESAGHLSHHRSKKGRDIGSTGAGSTDDGARETTLARGSGSFVVHGKKASVINLGTELQTLSQEDKILSRKQRQSVQSAQPDQPEQRERLASVALSNDDVEDDFHSAPETTSESNGTGSRRDSAASTSTATARSFKELHRKFSSTQSAKSISGGKLTVPLDGENEIALDVSGGTKSPQQDVPAQT
jgi:hypothetical protein